MSWQASSGKPTGKRRRLLCKIPIVRTKQHSPQKSGAVFLWWRRRESCPRHDPFSPSALSGFESHEIKPPFWAAALVRRPKRFGASQNLDGAEFISAESIINRSGDGPAGGAHKKSHAFRRGIFYGGGGGIRTHGRCCPSNDFESFSL